MNKPLENILSQTQELERIEPFRLGTLVRIEPEHNRIWVDYTDNPFNRPVLAKLGTPWVTGEDLIQFQDKVDSIKLEFEGGHPSKPIIRDLLFSVTEMKRSKTDFLKDRVLAIEADEIVLTGKKRVSIICGDTKTIFDARSSEITQHAKQISSTATTSNRIRGSSILLN